MKAPAYKWFLPLERDKCPDALWRAVYSNGRGGKVPVDVCAPDEETARMRAGMKLAELTRLDRMFWQGEFWRIPTWERVSLTQIG